ncbi:MAG TPA: histidine kinase [Longimicrobiales bacterium]|nr:histidine kinase [Longimicrobiales bacterium]
MEQTDLRGRGRPLALEYGISVLVWTLFGVLSTGQSYLGYSAAGEALPPLGRLALMQCAPCVPWALATPGVLALARRFPFRPWPPFRALAVHLAAAAVLAVASTVAYAGAASLAPPMPRPAANLFVMVLATRVTSTVVLYSCVLAVGRALDYQRHLREREVHAAQLQAQLASARLEALRSQLHPHFLFNALNTVAMHLREAGSAEGLDVVVNLSELLRRILRGEAHETTLDGELELLALYLAVERARFADRLRVEVEVEPRARRARVPVLLLQPLVENAVRHGIARSSASGRLRIEAAVEGERVRVRVADDGPGLRADAREGVGLGNTRARLEQLYPGEHRFVVRDAMPGTEVLLELPFRPVEAQPAERVSEDDGADSYTRR